MNLNIELKRFMAVIMGVLLIFTCLPLTTWAADNLISVTSDSTAQLKLGTSTATLQSGQTISTVNSSISDIYISGSIDGEWKSILTGSGSSTYKLTSQCVDKYLKVVAKDGTYAITQEKVSGLLTDLFKEQSNVNRSLSVDTVLSPSLYNKIGSPFDDGRDILDYVGSVSWGYANSAYSTPTEFSNNIEYTVSSTDVELSGKYIFMTVTGKGAFAGQTRKVVYGKMGTITSPLSVSIVENSGELEASLNDNNATGTYQWSWSSTEDGIYQNINLATGDKYKPVSNFNGTYIKVQFTGDGSYAGQVVSSAPYKYVAKADLTATNIKVYCNGTIDSPSGTIQASEAGYGCILEASVYPTNATVDYVWSVDGVQVGSGKKYVIRKEDEGKAIKVSITGNGDFSGTVEKSVTVGKNVDSIVITGNRYEDCLVAGDTLTIQVNDDATVPYLLFYRVYDSLGTQIMQNQIYDTTFTPYLSQLGYTYEIFAQSNYTSNNQDILVSKHFGNMPVKAELKGVTPDGNIQPGLQTASLSPENATADITWKLDGSTFKGNSYDIPASAAGKNIEIVAVGTGNYVGLVNSTAYVLEDSSDGGNTSGDYTFTLEGVPKIGETVTATIKPDGIDGVGWYNWYVNGEFVDNCGSKFYTIKDGDESIYSTVYSDTLSKDLISNTLTVQSGSTEKPSLNDNDCVVEVWQGQTFSVVVPLKIVLDGSKDKQNKATFDVMVTADIAGDDSIEVTPKNTELIYTEKGGKKNPLKGVLTVNKTLWSINKDGEDELRNGVTSSDNSITVDKLSAGVWTSQFDWTIKVNVGQEGYLSNSAEKIEQKELTISK